MADTLTLTARLWKALADVVASKLHCASSLVLLLLAWRYLRPAMQRRQRGPLALGMPSKALFPQFFSNRQGLWIYHRAWIPKESVRAVILIVHGFGEHCGRYHHLASVFNNEGFAVFSMDHQGHGQSHGERAYVDEFQHYVDDLCDFLDAHVLPACGEMGNPPVFLLGHSMGGLISVYLAQRRPDLFKGVVLSGPAIAPDPKVATPFMRGLAHVLCHLFPRLSVPKDKFHVSRDAQQQALYEVDPLIYRGGFRARHAHEMLTAMGGVERMLPHIKWPFFIIHGTEDSLVQVAGAQQLYRGAGSSDKTLRLYEGGFHELFKELPAMRDQAVQDVVAWIAERLS
eukprot:CAMPEP_0177655186 /NCGR_PEP_ID=MMETSP0447-20121125/14806_1 /TAXON_ID=0 /ORGANISM="Stygamoeba regulata, Strain BSH-02190019" /LENGTH=341 /DNA_ID=CAMNT_0019159035 /DNA_START=24 /DNA_END=1049 /DNA_ORIENTATION=+